MKELVNEHLFKLSAQQLLLKVILASEDFHLNFLKQYKRVNHAELINDWMVESNKENDIKSGGGGWNTGIKFIENYMMGNNVGKESSSSSQSFFLDIDGAVDQKLIRRSKIKLLNYQYCAMMEECLTFQIVDTDIEIARIDFQISLIESESLLKFPGTMTIKGSFTFRNIEEISQLGPVGSAATTTTDLLGGANLNSPFIGSASTMISNTRSSQLLSAGNNPKNDFRSAIDNALLGGGESCCRYNSIVSINVFIEYKVMIFGTVTSIEEKLYGECKKLFDLWFERLKIVENEVSDSVFNINTFNNRDDHVDLNVSIDEKQILNSSVSPQSPTIIITREMLNDWMGMYNNETVSPTLSSYALPEENSSTELKDMIFDFLIPKETISNDLEEDAQLSPIDINGESSSKQQLVQSTDENPNHLVTSCCLCIIL